MEPMKIAAIILCYLFLSSFAFSQDVRTERLNALLNDAASKDVFSGNVCIEEAGQPVYQKCQGVSDFETGEKNSFETRFSIGSITKVFTRVMVLQEIAEGKLKETDHLGQFLEGFSPEKADKITIGQLMNHQSGLGQYYDLPEFDPESAQINHAADFLPWIQKEPLLFQPGTATQYSNSGYVALAAILEKLDGKSYPEILQARILDPLGMAQTGFLFRNKKAPGKAVGYLSNQPGPRQNNLDMPLLGGGDGGMYSTVGDLLKFFHSLADDNKLLSDANKVNLVNEPLFPKKYASWSEFRQSGKLAVAGGAPGISAVAGLNLEKNRVVIVLSNYDEGSAEAIFQRIGAILNDMDPAPLQPSMAKFIYNLVLTKGPDYFSQHIEQELTDHGYNLGDDDMQLLAAGQPLLESRKADEAIAVYQLYTHKFPRIVVAWNDLGDAYLLKNDKASAKVCFQKALAIRPGNQRAKDRLNNL